MSWINRFLRKKEVSEPNEKLDNLSEDGEESLEENQFEPIEEELKVKQEAPAGLGIKRKWVIVGTVITLIIVLLAFFIGMQGSTKKNKKDSEQPKVNNAAIIGEHLNNVPAKYSDIKEPKETKEKEKDKTKVGVTQNSNIREVPSRPVLPRQPSANNNSAAQSKQLTAEEKQQLAEYEVQQKAYQSPIGFDLK